MAASTGWDEAVYRGLGELLNLLDQAEPDPGGLPSWAQAYPAELWLVLRRAVESRNLDTFFAWVREAVNRLFDQKVSFPQVLARLTPACELINVVVEAYQDDTQRALTAVLALSRMHSAVASLAGEVYAARRAEEVQEEQRRIIRELSTPVIEVWDGVLAMPLVGMVDSARAKQMMEQLLNRIVERQSRIVILDVTGVPSIDSGVADHLIRTTRAARLVGARSILAGISPQVAVTLVRMGISFGDLETVSDLRSALALALEMLGYKVVGPAS